MLPSIILILLLFVVFIMLLLAFLHDILIVLVNGIIIYLVGLRAVVEIKKRQEFEYVIGAIVSALLISFFGNNFPLWAITTFVFQAFGIVQIIKLLKKTVMKKKKH